MLVTANVVGLYLSIPISPSLSSLKKSFKNRVNKQIPISDLVKMAKFVPSNSYFVFSENVVEQISKATVVTKFEVKTNFLLNQRLKPLVGSLVI